VLFSCFLGGSLSAALPPSHSENDVFGSIVSMMEYY
jgi:hypothetical protein